MVKPEVRRLVESQMIGVRNVFAEALAARFGRAVDEIRDEGLGAMDFRGRDGIQLRLQDGSTMRLRYAFAVVDETQHLVGVFSEHCGYYLFPMSGLELVELRDDEPVSRRSW